MKYQTKSVIVDAFQWDGSQPILNQIIQLASNNPSNVQYVVKSNSLFVNTMTGVTRVNLSDWVVKGSVGEMYVLPNTVFNVLCEVVK